LALGQPQSRLQNRTSAATLVSVVIRITGAIASAGIFRPSPAAGIECQQADRRNRDSQGNLCFG
jgi:hypothetical protein